MKKAKTFYIGSGNQKKIRKKKHFSIKYVIMVRTKGELFMKTLRNFAWGAVALIIVVGGFGMAFNSYLNKTTTAAMEPASNVSQSFKTTYFDGSTIKYAVQKPLLSTEDVRIVYTGKGEAPVKFDVNVNKKEALLAAITKQNDVRSLLNYIHLSLNTVGIEGGRGHTWLLKDGVDGQNAWAGLSGKRWMDSPVYLRIAEVVDNPEVAKDFKNVAALADIVHEKQDAQAVAYMHQIIHDLDKWVYENTNYVEEVSHFGVTHAEDGDKVNEIEEYITERPTLPPS